jgi:hypothetical protein
MTTLSQAIANNGLVESKEIKKLMNSLKRKATSTTGRNFPTYRGQTTAQYVADFINQNRYKA